MHCLPVFELVQLVVYLVSLLGFPEGEDAFSWASFCAVELQEPAWNTSFLSANFALN